MVYIADDHTLNNISHSLINSIFQMTKTNRNISLPVACYLLHWPVTLNGYHCVGIASVYIMNFSYSFLVMSDFIEFFNLMRVLKTGLIRKCCRMQQITGT